MIVYFGSIPHLTKSLNPLCLSLTFALCLLANLFELLHLFFFSVPVLFFSPLFVESAAQLTVALYFSIYSEQRAIAR